MGKKTAEQDFKIELVAIGSISPNDSNPRVIKDDKFLKLVKSIREFPQMLKIRPIVVDANMVVLGGNMRLRACIEAGLSEVPIIKADSLTDEQKRRFIISDNVAFGEWDWDALANDWDSEGLNDWGLDVPGFETPPGAGGADAFSDEGISGKNSYGVIIMCGGEEEQEAVFNKMQADGYTCKIVVV